MPQLQVQKFIMILEVSQHTAFKMQEDKFIYVSMDLFRIMIEKQIRILNLHRQVKNFYLNFPVQILRFIKGLEILLHKLFILNINILNLNIIFQPFLKHFKQKLKKEKLVILFLQDIVKAEGLHLQQQLISAILKTKIHKTPNVHFIIIILKRDCFHLHVHLI